MTPLQSRIEALGGLIKTSELLLFMSRSAIAEALASGEIQRIRQAWYANPWLSIDESRAARVGGQLTCVSAAAALGMWDPAMRELHVAVDQNARGLRSPSSYRTLLGPGQVEVHWSGRDPRGSRTIVSPLVCIRAVASCASFEVALAVADSALARGVIRHAEWHEAVERFPRRIRRLLGDVRRESESGSESVFVHKLARAGVVVRQQVVIRGVGRVDCLIGERLIVEIDSIAWHQDLEADRRRDAVLSARGYRVLRFMYHQVMHEWELVEAAVLAAVARGDHLIPSAA